jgi:hypothetical protein
MRTTIAFLDMTAERRGSALDDSTHRSSLLASSPVAVLLKESFAVPPDYIGDFKRWP